MTVDELYYSFHLLLNKNAESKSINIAKENFVILYNRESLRWLSDFIEKNTKNDNLLSINELIVLGHELEAIENHTDAIVYKLPEDYFNLLPGDFKSIVKHNDCSGVIYNRVLKPNEINIVLQNSGLKPSFHWERGIGQVFDNKVKVFITDFKIQSTFISYFKIPDQIDMEGYITFENKDSENKNSNNSEYIQNQILDYVVTEVQRQFENKIGFELSKERQREF